MVKLTGHICQYIHLSFMVFTITDHPLLVIPLLCITVLGLFFLSLWKDIQFEWASQPPMQCLLKARLLTGESQ